MVLLCSNAWRLLGWRKRALNAAFIAMAAVSLLHYLHLPPFYELENRPVNVHDLTHYYLGAKYFPELGYDRLYQCFIEATGNDFGAVYLRDLHDRQVKPLVNALDTDGGGCRPKFSDERWSDFVSDVRTVRPWAPADDWKRFVQDSGFNAPPTWLVAGYWLTNTVKLSLGSIYVLTTVDVALLVLGLAALAASFGCVATMSAIIGLTTLSVATETWTIGSILRWDWLFFLMLSLAAVRRNWMMASGVAFGLSASLRIFPIAALAVIGLYAVLQYRSNRSLRPISSWAGGFVLGSAGLAAISLLIFHAANWVAFFENIARHSMAYSVNYMGLRTFLTLAWSLQHSGTWFPSESFLAFVKPESYSSIAWIHLAVAMTSLALLRRLGRQPPWVAMLAALAWIPFGWMELSSYYYMFWGCLFLVVEWSPVAAVPIAAGNAASWAIKYGLGESPHMYAATSAILCIAVILAYLVMDRTGSEMASDGPG